MGSTPNAHGVITSCSCGDWRTPLTGLGLSSASVMYRSATRQGWQIELERERSINMRQITVKYSGDCQKCGNTLPVGESAIYERRVGIFCVGCAPTDPEEIRAVRQVGADRKADRLEEWAEKREEKASTVLNSHSEIRHDWAFITQPGHIPFRARMIAADDRAHESLNVARGFRARAEGLRHVRVEGDAERKREIEREYTRQWIQLGMQVH